MSKQQKKRPGGRPPKGEWPMKLTAVRLPLPMLTAIDALGAERLDQPDRAAMIRELLALGIEVAQKRKNRG